jgi:hypothetical protein
VEDTFELFAGTPEKPLWIASFASLEEANRRMAEMMKKSPGNYFVFCTTSSAIVARAERPKR